MKKSFITSAPSLAVFAEPTQKRQAGYVKQDNLWPMTYIVVNTRDHRCLTAVLILKVSPLNIWGQLFKASFALQKILTFFNKK